MPAEEHWVKVVPQFRLQDGTFAKFLHDRLLLELKLGPADDRLGLLCPIAGPVDQLALAYLCDRIGEELTAWNEGHERVRRALNYSKAEMIRTH